MIIVTGATGQLGRLIVEKLVGRVPKNQIGVSVRDPKKAGDLEGLGVRVRQGDFNDADSLLYAFEGATQVLIVSSNARASGGDPLAQHRTAMDAAKAVGARRIVYTSHMAASATSAFPPAQDHAATEEMLSQSGLAWTALRHGFYAESGLMITGEGLKTGVIEAPADGKVSWTTHADLAEADAIILADEGRYDGPTPALTASQAIDLDEFAIIRARPDREQRFRQGSRRLTMSMIKDARVFDTNGGMLSSEPRVFEMPHQLEEWLKLNHEAQRELWVRIFKKDSGTPTVSFLEELHRNPAAEQFFAALDRRNLYVIYHRIQTAKRLETR